MSVPFKQQITTQNNVAMSATNICLVWQNNNFVAAACLMAGQYATHATDALDILLLANVPVYNTPSEDFTVAFLTLRSSQLLPAISFMFVPAPSSELYNLLAACATRLLLLLASASIGLLQLLSTARQAADITGPWTYIAS
jgi:hypothetical protein